MLRLPFDRWGVEIVIVPLTGQPPHQPEHRDPLSPSADASLTTGLRFFYLVAISLPALPRHSQAKLYPSELVTIGVLFALKGGYCGILTLN